MTADLLRPQRDVTPVRHVMLLALAIGLALVAAACGDSTPADGASGAVGEQVVSRAADSEVAQGDDAESDGGDADDDGDGFELGGDETGEGNTDAGEVELVRQLSDETCAAYRTFFDDEMVRARLVLRSPDLQTAAQERRSSAIDQLRRDLSAESMIFAAEAVRDLERYPFDISPGENFDIEILESALDTLRDELDPACNVSASDADLAAHPLGPLCSNFRLLQSIEDERLRLLEMNDGVIAAADRVRGDALTSVAASISGFGRDDIEEPLLELAEHPLAAPLSYDTFVEDPPGATGTATSEDGPDEDEDDRELTPEELAEEMRVPVQRLREVLAADCL